MSRNLFKTIRAVCLCAIIVTVVVAPSAQASKLGELRDKLSSYLSREENVKKELRGIKSEQQRARQELFAIQRKLDQAEASLRQAQVQLHKTKQEIAQTEQNLAVTKARLDKHQQQMQQYLLAVYRSGKSTYLEVVFQATSFVDFANRTEFTRRIAAYDQDLLTELVSEKQAFERQKAKLAEKRAQQEVLYAQVKQQRDVVEEGRRQARQELQRVNQDRAAAERLRAQMEYESRQIEQMLARLQRGSGGQRYSGNWSGSFKCPIWRSYHISSRYGWRIHPILHTRRFHDGVDLACPTGTAIHAGDKGLVIYAGWQDAYGKTILIDHGSGISTMYAHCSRFAVKKGQTVSRGQVIGYVGSTGWSTGPHLHFGVRKYGKPINPMKF